MPSRHDRQAIIISASASWYRLLDCRRASERRAYDERYYCWYFSISGGGASTLAPHDVPYYEMLTSVALIWRRCYSLAAYIQLRRLIVERMTAGKKLPPARRLFQYKNRCRQPSPAKGDNEYYFTSLWKSHEESWRLSWATFKYKHRATPWDSNTSTSLWHFCHRRASIFFIKILMLLWAKRHFIITDTKSFVVQMLFISAAPACKHWQGRATS